MLLFPNDRIFIEVYYLCMIVKSPYKNAKRLRNISSNDGISFCNITRIEIWWNTGGYFSAFVLNEESFPGRNDLDVCLYK
jgi:hypothetical protein